METIAVDFDGVLRKWPGFIGWYANFLRPDDILVRARLSFIRRLLTHLFMDYTPVILDGKLIDSFKTYKPQRLILVSGRCLDRQKEEVFRLISPYLKFDKFYFRENCFEFEEKFKERILKIEHVTFYIEDRRFVIDYLCSKGLKAIDIRDVRH